MPDGKAAAELALGRLDDVGEQIKLRERIGAALLVRLVGDGEVREDALHLQPRQAAGGTDGLDAGAEVLARRQETQPRHAGIDLDMYLKRSAAAHGLLAVLQCLGLTGHGLRDVVLDEQRNLLLRRVAEDEHGHGDPIFAQLHRLVRARDGQIVCTQLLQRLRDAHGPVSVGVGLHHAQKLHARPDPAAQRLVVVCQSVEINLRPGSPQCRFHVFSSFLSCAVRRCFKRKIGNPRRDEELAVL